MAIYATGNTAKAYCFQRLDQLVSSRPGAPVTVLDLGCGTASLFVPFLQRFPQVKYTGVEPSPRAAAAARGAVEPFGGRIAQQLAYDFIGEPQDIVVSFSVMEHVFDRAAYLRCAAANLKPDGVLFLNYDSGHFQENAGWRDKLKTLGGGLLAAAGMERYYQSFLPAREFRRMAVDAGLEIIEEKRFNLPVKALVSRVPEDARDTFSERWLEFELFLNELALADEDSTSELFMTRNFVMRRAPAPASRPVQ